METKEFAACVEEATVVYLDRTDVISECPWSKHPQFKGVYLKHIITGKDTGGILSCHMVKIEPNHILEDHVHERQSELHEVIYGDGQFILEATESSYHPGAMGMIPKGSHHKVCAGKSGLVLLAHFYPALL